MSLMNDALRKRVRETTESPASTGFADVSQQPHGIRRWRVALVAMILLTIATFFGIHLMQSGAGNSLLVNKSQPAHSRPPSNPPVDTSSDVQHRIDDKPLSASAGHQTEIAESEGPPKGNSLTTANLESALPSSVVSAIKPNNRVSESMSDLHTANENSASPPAAKPSALTIAPAEPSQREPNTVSRAFEPASDKTATREKNRSLAIEQPLSPAQTEPSPRSAATSKTIDGWNAGTAIRKTVPTDGEDNLFYKKARAYHRNGRLADAIRLYRQVLNADSSHPGAMLNLSAAYLQQGNYIGAAPLLKRLEQSNPRPQGVLLNLAMASIGLGAPEKALGYLDQAAAQSDATPWEIRFHRAVAFARMNRLPEALVLYRQAATERSDDPRLQFNLAVTCDALGLYPEAVTHYEAVLRNPSKPSETDRETINQRIRTLKRYLDTAQSPAAGQ